MLLLDGGSLWLSTLVLGLVFFSGLLIFVEQSRFCSKSVEFEVI